MFGGIFDLNGDGKTDWMELGIATGFFAEMEREERIREQIDALEAERLSLDLEEPIDVLSDEWAEWNERIMELDEQINALQALL